MPGRWSDEREWDEPARRPEQRDDKRGYGGREARSFDDTPRGPGEGRDRVFGERETGAQYNERGARTGGGPGYSGGAAYSGGPGYSGGRPAWQDRDYQGVSPAMRQGEYELERQRRSRLTGHDETGGRYYGDDGHAAPYREEYGRGPRGYHTGYRGYDEAGREDEPTRGEEFFRRAGQRVASWFGTARDEVRRDLFEGQHRGRGPKGYQRPDERLLDEAHQRLTDDPWVDASEISVSVSGAEVTLSGTVDSREAKHRAERCVEDIAGVKHVQNNLRVEGGGFFTRAGRGFGDSASEAQMRGDAPTDGDAATRSTTRRT